MWMLRWRPWFFFQPPCFFSFLLWRIYIEKTVGDNLMSHSILDMKIWNIQLHFECKSKLIIIFWKKFGYFDLNFIAKNTFEVKCRFEWKSKIKKISKYPMISSFNWWCVGTFTFCPYEFFSWILQLLLN